MAVNQMDFKYSIGVAELRLHPNPTHLRSKVLKISISGKIPDIYTKKMVSFNRGDMDVYIPVEISINIIFLFSCFFIPTEHL